MTQIEAIKNEIKRRIEEEKLKVVEGAESFYGARQQVYSSLLSFIESLEKEQNVNLEKEIEKCGKEHRWAAIGLKEIGAIARYFYKLGCQHSDNAFKIKGWVARDKDGSLTFFSVKPERIEKYAEGADIDRWWVPGAACTTCSFGYSDYYPDLKWEDEPIEVELIIKQ